MATSFENRLGTAPEEAVKAPCVAASTTNITLSGEQTISGINPYFIWYFGRYRTL